MGLKTLARPFIWVYLGFLTIVSAIITIFRWTSIGIYSTFIGIINYFIDVIKYFAFGILAILKPFGMIFIFI